MNSAELAISERIDVAIGHQSRGRLQEAERIYRSILDADPDNGDAMHLLGLIAVQTGENAQALEWIEKAIARNAGQPAWHGNLGLVLRRLGRNAEAIEAYGNAVRLNPAYVEAHLGLANLLLAVDRPAAAAASYQKVLSLRPDHAEAAHNLGGVHSMLGDTASAAACYRAAIAARPDYAEAHYNLAREIRCTDPAEIEAMSRLLAAERRVESRIYLNFGLGKALADLGEYARAFRHWSEGNGLKRETYRYDVADVESAFAAVRDTFDGGFFAARHGFGFRDGTPIFIVGMPRSGTTLIEQILSSHPLVHGADELPFVGEILDSRMPTNLLRDVGSVAPRWSAEEAAAMGREYVSRVRAIAPDARFVTDKMPDNFRLVGLIKLILPDAKIIHSVRSPEDTCLSIFRTNFSSAQGYACDLAEIGRYYRAYRATMDHWRDLFPGDIREMRYESLTGDQEAETRGLLEFCGLEWDESCLRFHETTRSVKTASSAQVRRPIYRSSVGGWKRYEEELRPLLDALGDLRSGM